jgi:hypothetical protein
MKNMAAPRSDAETVQISVRAKEPLRAALEQAAKERGVSMNAEIIDRLQRSFESERRIEDVFGSREVYGMMRTIAAAIDATGRSAGFFATRTLEGAAGWIRHPWAYQQAVNAAARVFEALRPAGDPSPPDHELGHIGNLGRGFASGILNEIARGEARVGTNVQQTAELRGALGPLVDRLTPEETIKEDLLYNVQRDEGHQVTVKLSNRKPEGDAK